MTPAKGAKRAKFGEKENIFLCVLGVLARENFLEVVL